MLSCSCSSFVNITNLLKYVCMYVCECGCESVFLYLCIHVYFCFKYKPLNKFACVYVCMHKYMCASTCALLLCSCMLTLCKQNNKTETKKTKNKTQEGKTAATRRINTINLATWWMDNNISTTTNISIRQWQHQQQYRERKIIRNAL